MAKAYHGSTKILGSSICHRTSHQKTRNTAQAEPGGRIGPASRPCQACDNARRTGFGLGASGLRLKVEGQILKNLGGPWSPGNQGWFLAEAWTEVLFEHFSRGLIDLELGALMARTRQCGS